MTVSFASLAQISFWLLENGFSVLIAACDTFRAGAVEQLRTHTRRLSALHPPEDHGGRTMVQLFEKGYGKDAAGIAMEAVAFGTVHSKCGSACGPFAPWAPLKSPEVVGSLRPPYPGDKSAVVTYRAFLRVIGVSQLKRPICLLHRTAILFLHMLIGQA